MRLPPEQPQRCKITDVNEDVCVCVCNGVFARMCACVGGVLEPLLLHCAIYLFQWLSLNVRFCPVVYSDVATFSLLDEIKATSTVFFQLLILFILF